MPAPTPVVIVLIADTGGRFSVETAYDVGSAVTKALLGLTPRSLDAGTSSRRGARRTKGTGRPWTPSQRAKFQRTMALKAKDREEGSDL